MKQKLSPNFDYLGLPKKTAVVFHGTLGSYQGSIEWLCNPKAVASAHVVVSKEGEGTELVLPNTRAWHAGRVSNPIPRAKAFFNGVNPNNVTLGIELVHYEGETADDITDAQIAFCKEYIKKCQAQGFLVENPEGFVHSEITDYKYDFKKNGKPDNSVVNRVFGSSKEEIKKQILELLAKL